MLLKSQIAIQLAVLKRPLIKMMLLNVKIMIKIIVENLAIYSIMMIVLEYVN